MRKIIYCIVLYFHILVFYQSNPAFAQQLPTVVPPSPEAASVFKFNEVPVSPHTGVPNISIPIFEIESGGVTVPISVNYHSRGIKVAEVASRVGLGWSLNYGGMISRQVRGNHDEANQFGYLNNNAYHDNGIDFFTNVAKRQSVAGALNVAYGEYDLVPDQYYFNANGMSGKFIFDYRDKSILAQNYSNLKLEKVDEIFTILDGQGNTYYFGENAKVDIDNPKQNFIVTEFGNSQPPNPITTTDVINTWHLTRIRTQTGQEIKFIYEKDNSPPQFYRRSHDILASQDAAMYGTPSPEGDYYKSYFSKIESSQHRIQQIIFDTGKVVFEYNSASRQDILNSHSLKHIVVYDKNNIEVKKVVFEHGYTTGTDLSTNHYIKGLDNFATKRLFLESLQVITLGDNSQPPYRFEYNPEVLPNRHSNSQDLWGYYNGKNNGDFLKFLGNPTFDSRAVDIEKSQAGMLEKIITPEGGSINFAYEHNIVNNSFPNTLIYLSPNPIGNSQGINLGQFDYASNFSNGVYTKTFTVGDNVVTGTKSVTFWGADESCTNQSSTNCPFSVSLTDPNNQTQALYIGATSMNLIPGEYTLKVIPANSNHYPFPVGDQDTIPVEETFTVSITWQEEVEDQNEFLYASGKRIKKIEYRDAQNNLGVTKTYSYEKEGTSETSGELFGLPSFYSTSEHLVFDPGHSEPIPVYEPLGAVPGSPLSTYQESTLGYGRVTEYYGESGNTIGKTVYEYTMNKDSGGYFKFPYHPPTDNEWLRGKELRVIHYKNNNGVYSPVRKIENEYTYADSEVTPLIFNGGMYRRTILGEYIIDNSYDEVVFDFEGWVGDPPEISAYKKDKKIFRLPLAHFYYPIGQINMFHYKVYHLTGGTLDVWRTTTTDYFDNNSSMVTTVDYRYDYDNHYNLSFSKHSTSDDNTSIYNRYWYAPNMNSGTIYQLMKNRNLLDMPIKIEKTEGLAIKLWSEETSYTTWSAGGNSFIAPEVIKTAKRTNSLEPRIRYNRYDDKGNPLEVQQENGTLISYIWGYNQSHPIAKIENGSYQEVEQYVANLQSLSNGTNETGLISGLNNLRTQFPNALITTYTYKPLVGVSTITDPRGYTITYEYDDLGRLELVKDADKNILEETNYHYRP